MKRIILENLDYIKDLEIIRRDYYFSLLQNFVSERGVFILTGQRRVGKSYVLLDFLQDKKDIFYLNKELDDYNKIKTNKELSKLFWIYKKEFGEPKYVVIDEIQDIENWEIFIRKLFSLKKYKIIITWSNSHLLSSEMATYLTGRYIQFDIYPLCFDEYLYFAKTINRLETKKELFLEYIEFGWLPEIFFIDKKYKKNYLKSIKDSIILKDIVDRFWVKNISVLEKIIKYLSDTLWSLASTSNITDFFKTNFDKKLSSSVTSRYIEFSKSSFLINEVSRYNLKWKRILEYVSKYYFSDIWIRNILWYNFNFDIWKILENIVYINLKKKWYEVYVGENKDKEIDFVAQKEGKTIYIQVTYLITSKNVAKREFWNLLEIKDNWPKYVVSMDENIDWNSYEWINHIHIYDIDKII